MYRGILRLLVVIAALLGAGQSWPGTPRIAVEGLLQNAAILNIDGQRKMLRVGQSFQNVTLLAAGPTSATLQVDGKKLELGLSRHIGSSYEQPTEQVVTIPRDARQHYFTTAQINGRSVRVLVDTGATTVAMSGNHARSLGIDYFIGDPGQVQTASGLASAYSITLQSVSVGGIKVDNVRASVVEGSYPVDVLLGMSYLRHVSMREHDGVLSLTRNH